MCAKTWSHSAMRIAGAKEGASEATLGPMWVSPPKVRCDHLQLPSPGSYVQINTGPESHPGLNTQGSLGEASKLEDLGPAQGWSWAGRREESEERASARKEPGVTVSSPVSCRETGPRVLSLLRHLD